MQIVKRACLSLINFLQHGKVTISGGNEKTEEQDMKTLHFGRDPQLTVSFVWLPGVLLASESQGKVKLRDCDSFVCYI